MSRKKDLIKKVVAQFASRKWYQSALKVEDTRSSQKQADQNIPVSDESVGFSCFVECKGRYYVKSNSGYTDLLKGTDNSLDNEDKVNVLNVKLVILDRDKSIYSPPDEQ